MIIDKEKREHILRKAKEKAERERAAAKAAKLIPVMTVQTFQTSATNSTSEVVSENFLRRSCTARTQHNTVDC